MRQTVIFFFLLAAVLLVSTCDNRMPTDTNQPVRIILKAERDPAQVTAQLDTLRIMVAPADSNNIVLDSAQIKMHADGGLLLPVKSQSGKSVLEYLFYYPEPTVTIDSVTITATYGEPGTRAAVSEHLVVSVIPLEETYGYRIPATINIDPKTIHSEVYQSAGGWSMFVYAVVLDSTGNPVEGRIPVTFTIGSTTADPSSVSIGNQAYTGAPRTIGGAKDSVLGNAITVLSYDRNSILDTVVIKASIETPGISVTDTIALPIPLDGLQMIAEYLDGGPISVGDSGRAHLGLTLMDAYNAPIPGVAISLRSDQVPLIPNCYRVQESGVVDGSVPCTVCDSVKRDTCIITTDSITMTDTVVCDTTCRRLDRVTQGITNSRGYFEVETSVSADHLKFDEDTESLIPTQMTVWFLIPGKDSTSVSFTARP